MLRQHWTFVLTYLRSWCDIFRGLIFPAPKHGPGIHASKLISYFQDAKQMKSSVVSVSMIFGLLFISGSLFAHHGEANYDTTKVVSVKGTVTNFEFINPHVQIFLDVKNDKNEIEKWIGEARSPSMLVRLGGWDKSTLKPGDVITASGHRAKNGSNILRLLKVTLPDGREMANL
jgi:hypothetical protein